MKQACDPRFDYQLGVKLISDLFDNSLVSSEKQFYRTNFIVIEITHDNRCHDTNEHVFLYQPTLVAILQSSTKKTRTKSFRRKQKKNSIDKIFFYQNWNASFSSELYCPIGNLSCYHIPKLENHIHSFVNLFEALVFPFIQLIIQPSEQNEKKY